MNNHYISAKEIVQMIGCNILTARRLVKETNEEIKQQGKFVPNMYKAPRERVIKKLGIAE